MITQVTLVIQKNKFSILKKTKYNSADLYLILTTPLPRS